MNVVCSKTRLEGLNYKADFEGRCGGTQGEGIDRSIKQKWVIL